MDEEMDGECRGLNELDICSWILQTLSCNVDEKLRGQASLKSVKCSPTYPNLLLKISQNKVVEYNIRIAASVAFKNFIKSKWSGSGYNDINRSTVLGFLQDCPILLKDQLTESLILIGKRDILLNRTDFVETLIQMLMKFLDANGNFDKSFEYNAYANFQTLHCIVQVMCSQYSQVCKVEPDTLSLQLKTGMCKVAEPLTHLIAALVDYTSLNMEEKRVLKLTYKNLLLICDVFNLLHPHNCFTASAMNKWLSNFRDILSFNVPFLRRSTYLEGPDAISILDQIKVQVYLSIETHVLISNQSECHDNYLLLIVADTCRYLLNIRSNEKESEMVIVSALKLLTTVMSTKNCPHIFGDRTSFVDICRKIVVPSLSMGHKTVSRHFISLGYISRNDMGVAVPLNMDNNTTNTAVISFAREFLAKFESKSEEFYRFYSHVVDYLHQNLADSNVTQESPITKLPIHIIEHILNSKQLSVSDFVHFGSTCKEFYYITKRVVLRKMKLKQRYPMLLDTFSDEAVEITNSFEILVEESYKIDKFLNDVIENFRRTDRMYYSVTHEPNNMPTVVECKLLLTIDKLINMLNDRNTDWTSKYYAKYLLFYYKREHIKMKYEKFGRRLGLNWLDLEKLAVLVAEWFHPKDTTLGPRISSMLDGVAEEVKIALRESNPSHPIAAECSDRDTALDFEDSKQILDCMLQSLASFRCQENVQVTHEKYKTSHLEDCICLNKVLESKEGARSALLIIFQSVARRLGVQCTPCRLSDTDSTLALVWKQCIVNSVRFETYTIHVINGQLHRTNEVGMDTNVGRVLKKMSQDMGKHLGNMPRCFINGQNLKLSSKLKKPEKLREMAYSRPVGFGNFNVLEDRDILLELQTTFFTATPIVRDRHSSQLKYPIGVILLYKKCSKPSDICNNNKCSNHTASCVIAGWICSKASDKPYLILCDGGIYGFASEDQLHRIRKSAITAIDNPLIKKFFSAFNGLQYVPNKELMRLYPKDLYVAKRYLAKLPD